MKSTSIYFKKIIMSFFCVSTCIGVAFSGLTVLAETVQYNQYINKADYPNNEIIVNTENLSNDSSNVSITEYMGETAVMTYDDSVATFSFQVENQGFYTLAITYCGIENKKTDIKRGIKINGEYPFKEAESISFKRIYTNETDEFNTDSDGNEICPEQKEVFEWQTVNLYDNKGYSSKPLTFKLEQGENTISLISLAEPSAITEIKFYKYNEPISYKEYCKLYNLKGSSAKTIRLQGEKADYKSNYSLAPLSVNSSADMDPISLEKTKYNAIGGSNWQTFGDTITWKFDIEEAGKYNILIRLLQNHSGGVFAYRQILIDNAIPFKECESYGFKYDFDWYNSVISDGKENYSFYFEKGTHTLSLRVTLGEMSGILEELETEVNELNKIYRELLIIMGTQPDTYRDYQFDLYIPETIAQLKGHSEKILSAGKRIEELYGTKTGDTQFLERFGEQLNDMYEKESEIAKSYSEFQNNISALADYVSSAKKQPMKIDYIELYPENSGISNRSSGFFEKLVFGSKKFLYSFISPYSSLNSKEHETVNIWVSSGRDQAQIIKSLALNDFTAKTGIYVDLKLVPSSALLPAMYADRCPDAVLSLPSTELANLAYRGALVNLEKYDDINNIKSRFAESALLPLTCNGSLYSIPVTQTFYAMFYRKDILEELEIDIPKTWNEVIEILPVLQKNSMTFGMPLNRLHHFAMLLYQNNQGIFKDDLSAVILETDTAIQSFSLITEFFSEYEVLQTFSFVNRFRSGNIPIGISEYTDYNTLEVSAPEISGQWGFAAVPGIEDNNGNINNTSVSVTNGCALPLKGKNSDNGYEFLKWWTSDEIQIRYGQQIENVLGSSARYASANLIAVKELPWNKAEYDSLQELWKNTRGIPEVPGGYFLAREINFAFSAVVNNNKDVAEELSSASDEINKEMKTKREEFGIE